MSSIKPTVNDETTLERIIGIDMPVAEIATELERLHSENGVVKVSWRAARGALVVTYDALSTSYEELTQQLESRGWVLKRGCWARWRANYYRFIDGNVRDNARSSAACCNRPPPGAGRVSARDR